MLMHKYDVPPSLFGIGPCRPPPTLPPFLMNGLSEAELRTYAERAAPKINQVLAVVGAFLSGENAKLSIGVAIGLYFAGFICSTMSILTACYIPFAFAFVGPKVYEMRKDQIDAILNTLRSKITSLHDKQIAPTFDKINRHIPRAVDSSSAESSNINKED